VIKAIISDLDGVIRSFPVSRNKEFEESYFLNPGELLSSVFFKVDLNHVVEGKIDDSEWRSRIANRIHRNYPDIDSVKLINEWSNFPGTVNEEVLSLYKEVMEKRPFVLMTNGTDKVNSDLGLLGIKEEFDLIINSSELGFAKPDPKIFRYALEKLQLNAQEVAFIDDSAKNVEVANEQGFKCHQYQSFKEFKDFCINNL